MFKYFDIYLSIDQHDWMFIAKFPKNRHFVFTQASFRIPKMEAPNFVFFFVKCIQKMQWHGFLNNF